MTSKKPTRHQPRTVSQFVAYQLARRLRDFDNLSQYLRLSSTYPLSSLLEAYRQATTAGDTPAEHREIFWQIFERSRRP